ncbi:MAG: efflux RND transporter periplasmic adaptor subunit, partial [Rhodanobacter sp.]
MTQKKLRNGLIGAVALVLVIGAFWHFAGSHAAAPKPRDTAAPVRVATVERRDMNVVEHTLGTIMANATVQVAPRVQGTLESADFKEGQFVKKGARLFQIDPRPFQAALDEARATLQRDQALLENAHRDLARYQTLYGKHLVSAQMHDTSATNVNVLAATVAQDKAAVDLAKLSLGYTRIDSPIDGKTGPLLVQPGNMVTANGSTIGGTALVTIAQIKPVKLSFNLPQS